MVAIAQFRPALALGALWMLASCQSTQELEGMRMSVSALGGVITDLNVGGTDTGNGATFGGSARLMSQSEDFPELDIGLRLDGNYDNLEEIEGAVTVDVESGSLSFGPTLRWNAPVGDAPVQPFIDIAAGYSHVWADVSLSSGGITQTSGDSGGGWWGGVGVGVEFRFGDQVGFQLGAEHMWQDYGLAKLDFDEASVQGFAGLTYRF